MENPSAMTPDQLKILEEMCQHPFFARSDKYHKILDHLARHSFPNSTENRAKRKVEVIKNLFYGRDAADTNVRTNIVLLRERVEKYAAESNYSEMLTIAEPSGKQEETYLVTFVPRTPKRLAIFWDSYIHSNQPTTIIYTEPLFFHDTEKRIWVRCLAINDRRDASAFPFKEHGIFRPAYNYVPIGEVRAMLEMSEWFAERRVTVKCRTFHHATDEEIPLTNLILLGPPRCNPIMQLLQEEYFHFCMEEDWIDVKGGASSDPRLFRDSRLNTRNGAQTIHALVTRLRHPVDKTLSVTSIASDHTRAIKKVCETLINNEEFEKTIPIPENIGCDEFQLILKAEVVGNEMQARPLELIKTWPESLSVKA